MGVKTLEILWKLWIYRAESLGTAVFFKNSEFQLHEAESWISSLLAVSRSFQCEILVFYGK